MLERVLPYLKIVVVVLALLLGYQVMTVFTGSASPNLRNLDLSLPSEESESTSAQENENASNGRPPRRGGDIPQEIQARIQEIKDSEIFGEKPKPKPIALHGIAGNTVFLSTPEGRTGEAKVGESLGSIKVLQIGSNRVLIEHEGTKKELTIFDGLGGTSLLQNK